MSEGLAGLVYDISAGFSKEQQVDSAKLDTSVTIVEDNKKVFITNKAQAKKISVKDLSQMVKEVHEYNMSLPPLLKHTEVRKVRRCILRRTNQQLDVPMSITMIDSKNTFEIKALLDSGCTYSCID